MVYVLNTGTPGFTFSEDNPNFSIGAIDFYGSVNFSGVFSAHAGSRLVNNGVIWSQQAGGVRFEGGGGKITNGADGSILGSNAGIEAASSNLTIINRGDVRGYNGHGIVFTSAGIKVINDGDVYGSAFGIYDSGGGGIIENTGLIRAPLAGVLGNTNGTTKIVNKAGGTIKSAVAAIKSEGDATIALDNKGTIDGKIVCVDDGGPDKIVNKGKIKGVVDLGGGKDSFTFAGGTQGPVNGGAGADRFDFKTKLAAAKDAARIADMTGQDVIGLSKALFAGIGDKGALKAKHFQVGKKANDDDDRIIYDKKTGNLFHDKDGEGGAAQKLFAKLDDGLNLKASDFLVIA